MKKLTISALAFAAATTMAGLAYADGPKPVPMAGQPRGPMSLESMDTNGDGKVSKDEFQKAQDAQGEAAFKKLDTNGDGMISHDEFFAGRTDRTAKLFDHLDRNHDGFLDQADRGPPHGQGQPGGEAPPPPGHGPDQNQADAPPPPPPAQ